MGISIRTEKNMTYESYCFDNDENMHQWISMLQLPRNMHHWISMLQLPGNMHQWIAMLQLPGNMHQWISIYATIIKKGAANSV